MGNVYAFAPHGLDVAPRDCFVLCRTCLKLTKTNFSGDIQKSLIKMFGRRGRERLHGSNGAEIMVLLKKRQKATDQNGIYLV